MAPTTTTQKRTRRFFSTEDKVKITERLKGGESYDKVSQDLNIHKNLLHAWMAKLNPKEGKVPQAPRVPREMTENAIIESLKAENAELRQEMEFYKRTAQLYSRESETVRRSEIGGLKTGT